ncbi:MAG: hypothetical protein M3342_08480 [Bacteroidota bacterium]|nr:hypothetical protein [Flavisolibacter sp.]MDQ3844034.1 hypothetical protein [Bacteroidota bacterium]
MLGLVFVAELKRFMAYGKRLRLYMNTYDTFKKYLSAVLQMPKTVEQRQQKRAEVKDYRAKWEKSKKAYNKYLERLH